MQIAANTAMNLQTSTLSVEEVVNEIRLFWELHALTPSIFTAIKILHWCHTFKISSDFEQAMTLITKNNVGRGDAFGYVIVLTRLWSADTALD